MFKGRRLAALKPGVVIHICAAATNVSIVFSVSVSSMAVGVWRQAHVDGSLKGKICPKKPKK